MTTLNVEDLVAIDEHPWSLGEPVVGQVAPEPLGDLVGGSGRVGGSRVGGGVVVAHGDLPVGLGVVRNTVMV